MKTLEEKYLFNTDISDPNFNQVIYFTKNLHPKQIQNTCQLIIEKT